MANCLSCGRTIKIGESVCQLCKEYENLNKQEKLERKSTLFNSGFYQK
jgi:predicted nucleic acid-binding Zn ribbon protein